MVPLVKSLKITGFNWNDKASWGKHKPQNSKDVTGGWGLTHTMLGPNNKVIKWLWKDSETLTFWVSGRDSLFRYDPQVHDLKSTRRKTQDQHRWWNAVTEQASVSLSISSVLALLLHPTHLLWSLDLLLLIKCLRWTVPESWTTVLESLLDFSRPAACGHCHWTPLQPGKRYTVVRWLLRQGNFL